MNPILIADPDPAARNALALILKRRLGIDQVIEAGDIETLIRLLADRPPALLLLDWSLCGAPAFETCRLLRKAYPTLKIALLSADAEDFAIAQKAEAAFIHKGENPEVVIATISSLLES